MHQTYFGNWKGATQCIICKYVIEPPAFFANCCGKVIGCKKCITPAIVTEGACPHCRSHATDGIHIVRGLEFLSELKKEIYKDEGIQTIETTDDVYDANKQDYVPMGPVSVVKYRKLYMTV